MDNSYRLIQGDCLEVMKDIPDGSIDLIVTDPPYKIISGGCRIKDNGDECSGILNKRRDNKRTDWVDEVRTGKIFLENEITFKQWLPEMYRVLKNGTHIYIMTNDRNMQEALNESVKAGFKLVNILAWKKNNCTPNRYYMKNLEYIIMLRKGKAKNINNMGSKQCLEINNIIGTKKHPTEKPSSLMEIMINNSSAENDMILDPFMGSGSTGVACINTNRKFIGIELDEKYFNIAKERIENS